MPGRPGVGEGEYCAGRVSALSRLQDPGMLRLKFRSHCSRALTHFLRGSVGGDAGRELKGKRREKGTSFLILAPKHLPPHPIPEEKAAGAPGPPPLGPHSQDQLQGTLLVLQDAAVRGPTLISKHELALKCPTLRSEPPLRSLL